MKVLMLNGSPHQKGATYLALKEMEQVFIENNIVLNLGYDMNFSFIYVANMFELFSFISSKYFLEL